MTVPQDPANDGPFNFLPWEQNDVQGGRFVTRQELDWPFQLGPVKVVPYALGEAAQWGQDINGNPLTGSTGKRASGRACRCGSVDPTISSDLLNIHGIAHKIVFESEFRRPRRTKTSIVAALRSAGR